MGVGRGGETDIMCMYAHETHFPSLLFPMCILWQVWLYHQYQQAVDTSTTVLDASSKVAPSKIKREVTISQPNPDMVIVEDNAAGIDNSAKIGNTITETDVTMGVEPEAKENSPGRGSCVCQSAAL